MLNKTEILLDDICYFIDSSSQVVYGKVVALFTDGTVYLEDLLNHDIDELYIKNCDDLYHAYINEPILSKLGFNKLSDNSYLKSINGYDIIISQNSDSWIINKIDDIKVPLDYNYGKEKIDNNFHQLRQSILSITNYNILE